MPMRFTVNFLELRSKLTEKQEPLSRARGGDGGGGGRQGGGLQPSHFLEILKSY